MPASDVAYSLLVDLVRGLENRPITSNERTQIESEVLSFVRDNGIEGDAPILRRLSERLSYSYFPTVSNLKDLSYEKKVSTVSHVGNTAISNDRLSILRSKRYDFANLSLQPARKDVLYVCSIKRTKSALSTSYRMIIENVKIVCSAFDCVPDQDSGGESNLMINVLIIRIIHNTHKYNTPRLDIT